MRTRLQHHSRRLVSLLLAVVIAELLYVGVSVYAVQDNGSSIPSKLTSLFSGNPLEMLSGLADPNRKLPGLVSGSRQRLSDRLLAYALPNTQDSHVKPTADDLVNFYRFWKFDTAIRYVVPCTLSQTFLGRLQESVGSLQELFPKSIDQESLGSGLLERGDDLSHKDTTNHEYPLRTYNYDPRAPTTVYYDELMHHIRENGGLQYRVDSVTGLKYPSFQNLSLPFSWYDWTDSQILNGFIDMLQSEKPQCSDVVRKFYDSEKLLEYERKFGYKLFEEDRTKGLGASKFSSMSGLADKEPAVEVERYCIDELSNALLPGFKSIAPLNFSRPELYGLQARATLLESMESPNSLTFLNRNGSSIQIDVSNAEALDPQGKPQNILFNGLLENYMKRNMPSYPSIPKADHSFDNILKFKELKTQIFNSLHGGYDSNEGTSATSALSPPASTGGPSSDVEMPYSIELTEADFEFDAKQKLQELRALTKRTRHQQMYMESLEGSMNTLTMDLKKYFTEASLVTDYTHMGHHFDSRFFRGAVQHGDMRSRLDAIVRAWLNFVHSNGLSSWLSHGTLYGWMYNGMAFPWDGDHDMQMPIVHLNMLAERFNQSLIIEDPETGNGRFFLDVGNSITSRVHGNGNNNIDARFIDVDSGLYVDITGLSVSSDGSHGRYKPFVEEVLKNNHSQAFFKDPNIVKGVTDLLPSEVLEEEQKRGNMTGPRLNHINVYANSVKAVQNGHDNESPEERYNMNKAAKLYNCRNNHFSHLSELSPLRLTYFHGAKAYVPNRVVELLKHEYGVPANYSYLEFGGSAFVPEFRQWVDRSTLRTMAQTPSSPIRVSEKAVKELDFRNTVALFQNAAVVSDESVESFFGFLWNSFQVTTFRQKELELMYDEDRSREEKLLSLEEFVRDRTFTGAYKDPFQNRLETVVWYNLLDRSSISYAHLNKLLKKQSLQNADRLLELNVLYNQKNFPWTSEGGYQHPPSPVDYNHRGSKFFVMGEHNRNEIFSSDPKTSLPPSSKGS
ncbi:LAFA_0E03356g1_1 [Lachancea sp. 'fantastica']|nr:LAFA_0E03356g1_1 [Lachancea sp. 'fantastica']